MSSAYRAARLRCVRSGAAGCSRLVVAALALGCAEFEPGTDTLPEGSAAALQPAPDAERWGCLGSGNAAPAAPPVFSEAVARVVFSLQLVDLSSGQIYPTATVRACGLTDVTCESPVADGLTVDASGWVDVPLFEGFTGFIEITSPELLPMLFYLTEPLPAVSVTEYPLAVISRASFAPLVQLVGVEYQPGTGVLAGRAFDCQGSPASGVTFTSESAGVPWFFLGGLPSGAVSASSGDGLFGIVNVPPGLAVIDVRAPDGRSIAGRQSIVMRPDWMSAVFVRPRSGG